MKLFISLNLVATYSSLPSRERGLKSLIMAVIGVVLNVAPFAGAWIEMPRQIQRQKAIQVAPFAGAWIEIFIASLKNCNRPVAPFAGAWIEIKISTISSSVASVAPFAGAWIEIISSAIFFLCCAGRSLRGSVD